ncbi:MAG: tRNA preQ1(34) S-adenosylmethionine ribosyltransferase-isomerase QueA [Proteobacteria bacterium]|nr:tRNA preQ1(34) S-adenosylmethionine ribosyltransferase-isomerase QueA [Pseudomonadota bacterium]
MELTLFDYDYPEDLVAQRPLPERDSSRMMLVDRARRSFDHSRVSLLPSILRRGDLLVLNDSRVAAARLFGTIRGGERVELLVVEKDPDRTDAWRCLLRQAKRMRAGEKIFFGMQATATVAGRDGAFLLVDFKGDSLALAERFHGVPPLPPYIKRDGYSSYTDEDRARYQTVYANNPGSAAAPTAGLHLSGALLDSLAAAGVETASVTLHVGIDTFTPVRAENLEDHTMHGERVEIGEEAAHRITMAKAEGRRVICVGTTAARAIESAAAFEVEGSAGFLSWANGRIHHGAWTTRLFIRPGYEFRAMDAIITNFHQPRSTLLTMVSAFAGREFILSCYREAVRERYRLFSYGDCMFIV